MRNPLNHVLKEYIQTRLKEIKRRHGYTIFELAEKLHVDSRTVAAILSGEHSMGGLTIVLFLVFVAEDPNKEIANLRTLFLKTIFGTDDESLS